MTPVLRTLTDAERFDWLCLIRSENVGPRTFQTLVSRYGSVRAVLEALPRSGGQPLKLAPLREVGNELDAARRAGVQFVALCEPAYPPSLRVIDSAPPLLAVKGRLDVLQRSMVAIVGSRNASAAGLVFADRLASGVGAAGHVVVSGLARGIDARAHLASLSSGTVAVLAGGHHRIYPSEHTALVARIAEDGAVISEMPMGWEPRARDFPRRNRIVSGLSLGVVVVEAARRSGSLITARLANEQGREVFAVPGSPLDPRAEGTNDLLRQGATICTSADDVTDALRLMVDPSAPRRSLREPAAGGQEPESDWEEIDRRVTPRSSQADIGYPDLDETLCDDDDVRPVKRCLADLIGAAPVSVDELVRVSGIPAHVVQSVMIELELDGVICRHGASLVSRALA